MKKENKSDNKRAKARAKEASERINFSFLGKWSEPQSLGRATERITNSFYTLLGANESCKETSPNTPNALVLFLAKLNHDQKVFRE